MDIWVWPPAANNSGEWYKRVLEAGGTSTRQKIAGPATKDRLPRVAGKWMATGAAMADK